MVGPASRVATLVDRDRFWVRVAVPTDRLQWLGIPGINGNRGSDARVIQTHGHRQIVRDAKLLGLYGDLEPRGKLARLLVEVARPLDPGLDDRGEPGVPLLIGEVVTVQLDGPELTDVLAIPRLAVRDNNEVWIDEDGRLVKRVIDCPP